MAEPAEFTPPATDQPTPAPFVEVRPGELLHDLQAKPCRAEVHVAAQVTHSTFLAAWAAMFSHEDYERLKDEGLAPPNESAAKAQMCPQGCDDGLAHPFAIDFDMGYGIDFVAGGFVRAHANGDVSLVADAEKLWREYHCTPDLITDTDPTTPSWTSAPPRVVGSDMRPGHEGEDCYPEDGDCMIGCFSGRLHQQRVHTLLAAPPTRPVTQVFVVDIWRETTGDAGSGPDVDTWAPVLRWDPERPRQAAVLQSCG